MPAPSLLFSTVGKSPQKRPLWGQDTFLEPLQLLLCKHRIRLTGPSGSSTSPPDLGT